MNTILKRSLKLAVFYIVIVLGSYAFIYNEIYKSISVSTVDNTVVEYGTSNYDVNKLINKVDGKVVSVKQDIDTSKVGVQEVILEVEKNAIVKEVPIYVEIKDTVAPVIELKEETITVNQGDSVDVLSNVNSIYDAVDGNLNYQMNALVNESVDTDYYTVSGNVDTNVAGEYTVSVKAVDKYGNSSIKDYVIKVNAPVIENKVVVMNNVGSANFDTSSVVSIAYSLVGSRYTAGGNNPATGFDCSGFVQYVMSQVGVSVSRSSSTQLYDGVGVSYENAQPGDILSWGYVDGVSTHSALYIGNGLMIHATNPTQGVIVSDVAAWTRGSGTRVIAVRRSV